MNLDFKLAAERSKEILQSLVANLPNYVLALSIVLAAVLVGVFAGRQMKRAVARTGAHYGVQNLLASMTRVGFGVVGILIGLGILGVDAAAIVAGAGVAGLVIGIAFKDILENFMAGILLLLRQPFTVGDRISSNGFEGSVTEINLRTTVLKTYDGEEARIPNGAVLRTPILNRTAYPAGRTVVEVRIPSSEDLARARQVIEEAVRSVPGVKEDPAPEVAVVGFEDGAVRLHARLWSDSLGATVNRVSIQSRIRVKEALDEAGIALASGAVGAWLAASSTARLGDEKARLGIDSGR